MNQVEVFLVFLTTLFIFKEVAFAWPALSHMSIIFLSQSKKP